MKLGITMLIHNKDDIEFGTEFSYFLGHSVSELKTLSGPESWQFTIHNGTLKKTLTDKGCLQLILINLRKYFKLFITKLNN